MYIAFKVVELFLKHPVYCHRRVECQSRGSGGGMVASFPLLHNMTQQNDIS
jgi:hypothetical protein